MCGVAGIVAARGHGIEADRLADMAGMLRHRGPDDQGIHVEPAAGLAHTRVSVIDVAGGAQPMSKEERSLWFPVKREKFKYIQPLPATGARGHRIKSLSNTQSIPP